jgi:hypothetical protein
LVAPAVVVSAVSLSGWTNPDGTPSSDGDAMGAPHRLDLDALPWEQSYDRATLERFIAEVDAERARLRAEIEVAKARTRAARAGGSVRQAERHEALGALVLAAERELAELEAEHDLMVAEIQAAADAEAARILEAARAEVARRDASPDAEGPDDAA